MPTREPGSAVDVQTREIARGLEEVEDGEVDGCCKGGREYD